jgi:hypothetical protein
VDVEAKIPDAGPELAKVIKDGDIERDEAGREIGSIIKVIDIVPSERLVPSNDLTKLVSLKDPVKKDITVTLRLYSESRTGNLSYKVYPVKIGSAIGFSTTLYNVSAIVTKISDSMDPLNK